VPLGLKKLGVDPAVAANIFVTPMTDSLGFFFFLGLAKVFLVYLY
jgi:magnesium transporter